LASRRADGTHPAGALVRARRVQKIVRLEARARRLLTRYERALTNATRAKAHAHVLLDEAHGLECSLTGTQLGELHRARADALGIDTPASSPAPDRSSTTPSP